MRAWRWLVGSLCCGLAAISAQAQTTSTGAAKKPQAETVEMFAAIKSGEIEVKVFAKDSTGGNVLIKNKTNKPLTIKLPEAFAGAPVAAQFGGGGGNNNNNNNNNNNQNQGFGGGFGGGGGGGFGGGGGGQGGGGFFNVPAEKVGKLPFVAVCLEHGKNDPSPVVAYELKPIEEFTNKQEVIELMKSFGRGEIPAKMQHVVQAAAWHLENGLSWDYLAVKIGVKHIDGRKEPYFTTEQLQQAVLFTAEANRRAEEVRAKSPQSGSLSGK